MTYDRIKTPDELYEFMKYNIKYGFVSSYDNKIYVRKQVSDELYEDMLFNTYFLQTPEQLLESKYGICYDQVELAKKWFLDNGYDVFTYFSDCHNHTILIYKDKNTYNLFERSFPKNNSIYRSTTLEDALDIYKKIQFENNDVETIKLYKYDDLSYGIGFYDFINKCKEGNDIIELTK